MRKILIFVLFVLFLPGCSKFVSTYNQGLQAHTNNDISKAEQDYLAALKLKPEDADVHNNLGCLYLMQKEYQKAKDYLEKAISLNPMNGNFYYNLGLLFEANGDMDEALRTYKESFRIDPENAKAAYNIGNIYLDRNDLENAESNFNSCIAKNSRFYDAYYNLAMVCEKKGENDKAIQFYEQYASHITDENERVLIEQIVTELEGKPEPVEAEGETVEDRPPFPANLVIVERKFNEPSGNRALDAEEKAEISITIENKSQYPGNAMLKLTPLAANTGIKMNRNIEIGIISGMERKAVSIPIEAEYGVTTQKCSYRIEILETYYHLDPNPFILSFDTREFAKPELAIIFKGIADDKNISVSNNNNELVDPMEMIRVELSVQNIGLGTAKAVKTIVDVEKAEEGSIFYRTLDGKTNNEFELGDLRTGEIKNISFLFFTNTFYNYPEVNIKVNTSDRRGYSSTYKDINLMMGTIVNTESELKITQIEERNKPEADRSSLVDVDDVLIIEENLNKRENTYAVIIGIEDYKYNAPAMYKNRDATVFYQYVIKTLGVPDKNIFLRTSEGASKAEIDYVFDERIGWLKKRIKPEISEVIVFLAGHGYPDIESNTPYFLPYDVRAEQATNGLALNDLYKKLADLNAKNVLVFIESCFSGMTANDKPLVADINPVGIKVKFPELYDKNCAVITAASGHQVSSNSDALKHGIFTYYLLKGLKNDANTDNDNELTLFELWNYVNNNVSDEALNLDRAQNPLIFPDLESLQNTELINMKIVNYK